MITLEWLDRRVRCVVMTTCTSVIIGQLSALQAISEKETIALVDIEGTMTCVEIDPEFWTLETLDNADKPKLKHTSQE